MLLHALPLVVLMMTLQAQMPCQKQTEPFQTAFQAGIDSDTAIQNSVMRVARQQGQSPAQLEEYVIRLHRLGLAPDEQTFNVLLRAYVAHGQLAEATAILDRMGAAGESLYSICSCESSSSGLDELQSLLHA